ncbi:hypothetical protein [uncultured Empedobacter sp.]|uniref:hypothetical protein n=1 Tax=uncultured Empedobacter sp. TaxID=410844 RepID=UPI0025DE1DFC|nr:hypothetical protein [uncultured Empedobacter sp.]
MKFLYKTNKILEIILFFLSVFIVTYLSNEKLYIWLFVAIIIIIFLEIILKNNEYNFILKRAQQREIKIKEQENNGITNHYFMKNASSKNNRNDTIANAIDNANELYLIAETGKSYLDIATDRHWKNIKKKLDGGIHLRVLLIDPYCENKSIRNRLNNIKGEMDRKLDLDNLITLNKKYDNLEIRFTNQIYNSLFFTDKYMIYDPYHLGKVGDRIENNFIALEFKNDNDNYNILKSHFTNSWQLSKSFEEVINNE